jgi:osmoprotectant transport system permease protein
MHNFITAFQFVGRNGQIHGLGPLPTLVHLSLETLKVAFIGMVISMVIAIPLGVWLGHLHRFSFLAINLGNVWRALPSLAVLAIGDAFVGIGLLTVELALIVLAVPPMITNAYVAVDGVDPEIVDAARGMGLTGWQIVRKVQVPMGIPLIFAGIRTASLFVISTTTISSLAGYSGTLGDIVNNEASYHLSGVIGSAYCIAALALAVEFLLSGVQRLITPRGLKLAGETSLQFDTVIDSAAAAERPVIAGS